MPVRASSKGCIIRRMEIPSNKLLTIALRARPRQKSIEQKCLSPAKNGEYNRTREKWQLSDKLFEIATRAVSDDRTKRQQSIRQFTAEWEAAQ